jgi:hypothetical protein
MSVVRVDVYQSSPMAEATIQPPTNDVPNRTQTVVHNFESSCIVLSRSRSVEISHSIVRISNCRSLPRAERVDNAEATKCATPVAIERLR